MGPMQESRHYTTIDGILFSFSTPHVTSFQHRLPKKTPAIEAATNMQPYDTQTEDTVHHNRQSKNRRRNHTPKTVHMDIKRDTPLS